MPNNSGIGRQMSVKKVLKDRNECHGIERCICLWSKRPYINKQSETIGKSIKNRSKPAIRITMPFGAYLEPFGRWTDVSKSRELDGLNHLKCITKIGLRSNVEIDSINTSSFEWWWLKPKRIGRRFRLDDVDVNKVVMVLARYVIDDYLVSVVSSFVLEDRGIDRKI